MSLLSIIFVVFLLVGAKIHKKSGMCEYGEYKRSRLNRNDTKLQDITLMCARRPFHKMQHNNLLQIYTIPLN